MRVTGGKIGKHECLSCGWLLNTTVTKNKLSNLMAVVNESLSSKASNKHAKDVVKKVVNRLEWQKEFIGYHGSDYPFCRHCVVSLADLFAKKGVSVDDLPNNYDFGRAIIY